MFRKRLGSFVVASSLTLLVAVACSDSGSNEGDETTGGSSGAGGKANSAAGSSAKGGTANTAGTAGSGHAGSAGSGGSTTPAGGAAGESAMGGQGGTDSVAGANAGGAPTDTGGQGGESWSEAGAGGSGGDATVSCATTRTTLLGPISSVSVGVVELTSDVNAATTTLRIDASAGGYLAAATNPYIYISLAGKAAVAVSDVAADASNDWDLAFKRDNIRSNGGDSGSGNAQVAVLTGVDFDTVTAAAATTAAFGHDQFVDPQTCEAVLDGFGKPLTRFDAWYDYNAQAMTLAPAAKVYLVKAANGTSLYKLQLTDYYVDVPNGSGGTVKKSAVYSLKYQALQ